MIFPQFGLFEKNAISAKFQFLIVLYLQFIAAYKMKMKTDFLILRLIIFFTKSVL